MSSELQAAVIGAFLGGAFVLVAVVLEYLLTTHGQKKQRKKELGSLVLLVSWELQVLEGSLRPKDPTVRFNLTSLTRLIDRGFLGDLPAKLRDALLAIDCVVQIANDLADVIGPRPNFVTTENMLRAAQLADHHKRLREAHEALRSQVQVAIPELNELLPKLNVKGSIIIPPDPTSAPVPDSPSLGQ
jgi:hypothetical protein